MKVYTKKLMCCNFFKCLIYSCAVSQLDVDSTMTMSCATHSILIGMITHSEAITITWSKRTRALYVYQRLLKLGKYHFCIMSERTLRYRTDNVRAKCSKSWKWENGKREAQSAEMHVCVGWCVKWNSLWCFTMLPSYNFIEWMISMIVTVRLLGHSKYCTNQTGSIYINVLKITLQIQW